MTKKILYESDWLGSNPVFYNDKTGKTSNNINEVIDFENLEFHPEGFNNYINFGYSVFEQTPVKNVKILRYSSRLLINEKNKFEVEHLNDPVELWSSKVSQEDDVLDILSTTVKA
ncbi:MAG: hypothetical protein WBP45_09710, partial [Daejeonella sp.]